MPTGYVHLFIYGSKSDMIVRCLSVRNNVFVKNNPFSGIRIFIVVIVLATSSTLSTLIPILLNTVIMPEHLTTTGSATNDSTATEVARYDANVNMLTGPAKGLNIVRYSDGTVKKIMVEETCIKNATGFDGK